MKWFAVYNGLIIMAVFRNKLDADHYVAEAKVNMIPCYIIADYPINMVLR